MKILENCLKLDIDEDIFLDKIVEDLFFIDRVLEQILESLRSNPLLIVRHEHLRGILRAKNNFVTLLTRIIRSESGISFDFTPFTDKIQNCIDSHEKGIGEIRAIITDRPQTEDSEELVSSEEFEFLFRESDTENP